MREDMVVVEPEVVSGAAEATGVCRLPAASAAPLACPTCGRTGTLTPVGDVLFCAACGYASDGARGCT